MKITIEVDGIICVVEDKDRVTLYDALELIGNALKGVGFCFDGEVVVEEPIDYEKQGE